MQGASVLPRFWSQVRRLQQERESVIPASHATLPPGILPSEPELPVWGVDSEALEAVVGCFYTGECKLTVTTAVPIMDAAQRLEVSSLAAFCERFITESLGE